MKERIKFLINLFSNSTKFQIKTIDKFIYIAYNNFLSNFNIHEIKMNDVFSLFYEEGKIKYNGKLN